jgi:cell division protein FtsB
MSGPAERAAARQAARRSTSSAATSASSQRTATRAKVAAAVRDRPTLTGRAVVLACVLGLVVFTLAVPTRELFRQRGEINALRSDNAAAQSRVDQLTTQDQRLQDPAYVTSLIRERLHYVLPGEVGYVVLDPNEAPAPTSTAPTTAKPAWYATLWQAVQSTDQAGLPPGPTRIDVRPNAPR